MSDCKHDQADQINELKGLVSDLVCDVFFWKTKAEAAKAKLAEKPAYHCPKCDSWFSEDELKALGEAK